MVDWKGARAHMCIIIASDETAMHARNQSGQNDSGMANSKSVCASNILTISEDERNQLLTSLAWIHFRWNDWRIAWDPRMNGGIAKMKVPVEVPKRYPFIDVYLLLERKPLFFVIFSCLPCVLISVLVLLGFYMPSDSGEKVTLGITSLLSTTVFLMLVSEHLPPTADALPLIGIYYGVTIFIVSLQTAFTVFTLNIHHIGTNGPPVPRILQKLLFGRVSRLLLLNLEKQYHSINEHVNYFIGKQKKGEQKEKKASPSPRVRRAHSANFFGANGADGGVFVDSNVQFVADGSNSLPKTKKKRVSFTDDYNFCCHQQNGALPSASATTVSLPTHRYGRRILSLISPVILSHKHHPNCAKMRVATVSNIGKKRHRQNGSRWHLCSIAFSSFCSPLALRSF
ncbi:hypothetical protein niasHT_007757 [Heterodera trifolii]|uniref:Neurotransmitter-gated ion-channel transmembrane domain-containing protein n=1 Tax=Heterodera trifolii TaxID=157864 RepID=A0ABD2LLG7_9BILA